MSRKENLSGEQVMAAASRAGSTVGRIVIVILFVLVLLLLGLVVFLILRPRKTVIIHTSSCKNERQDPILPVVVDTQERDYRVLNDPLYPPLNRTDSATQVSLKQSLEQRTMYVPTNDTMDSYRLVGYLVSRDAEHKDMGGNNWKLMARQKDRNTYDFYMIPANNNYDVKVKITDDMVHGTRLRTLDDMPNAVTFDSPLLNPTPYDFVEIPKADLVSAQRYL